MQARFRDSRPSSLAFIAPLDPEIASDITNITTIGENFLRDCNYDKTSFPAKIEVERM